MAPLQGDLQVLAGRVVASGEAGLAGLGQHREVQINGLTGDRKATGQIGGEGGAGKGVGVAGPGRAKQAGAALPEALEALRRNHTQTLPGLDLAREGRQVIGEDNCGAAVRRQAGGETPIAVKQAAACWQAELKLHGLGPSRDLQVEVQGSPLAASGDAAIKTVDLGGCRLDGKGLRNQLGRGRPSKAFALALTAVAIRNFGGNRHHGQVEGAADAPVLNQNRLAPFDSAEQDRLAAKDPQGVTAGVADAQVCDVVRPGDPIAECFRPVLIYQINPNCTAQWGASQGIIGSDATALPLGGVCNGNETDLERGVATGAGRATGHPDRFTTKGGEIETGAAGTEGIGGAQGHPIQAGEAPLTWGRGGNQAGWFAGAIELNELKVEPTLGLQQQTQLFGIGIGIANNQGIAETHQASLLDLRSAG